MKPVSGSLVLLAFATFVSAQFPRECGAPPRSPQYARLDPKQAPRHKSIHGDEVHYDCAEDHDPSRGIHAVQCINGTWSRVTLTCDEGGDVKITCPEPLVANGVKNDGSVQVHLLGDSVTFTCNPGFRLAGPQKVTCDPDGQWQPQLPLCLPSDDTSCKEPTVQLKNKYTIIRGLKRSYKHGDSLSFSCREPYFLNGSTSTTCGLNGKWKPPLPACKWIKCSNLNVSHARLTSRHRRVGAVITVRCNKGYQQKGPNQVICLKNGKWSGIPKCVSEKEADSSCSSPDVTNSRMSSGNIQVYQLGMSVTFSCDLGFRLHGTQQVTCGPAGQWQPQLPKCLPTSDGDLQSSKKDGGCGAPTYISDSNAHLADRYATKISFASDEQVHYVCDTGYVQVGGSRYCRCVKGKWTPLLLKCERRSCGSAGDLLNGDFEYSGAEFGDTATAVCNEGYRLVGRGTRTCLSYGWDGHTPKCEAVQCEEPPEVENADRIGVMGPGYMYRVVIGYRCRVGMLIGPTNIWCTKNGTWSNPLPKCGEIICPPPKLPNAYWSGAIREPYQYRDVLSFECNWGYEMVGWSTVSCGADGQWTPGLPECRRNTSPSTIHVKNIKFVVKL